MSADQIAVIRPAIVEAIEGAPETCATFEKEGDADKWVQLVDCTINAAYPHDTDPAEMLKGLFPIPGVTLQSWEPRKYVTFQVPKVEARSIAEWIDAYFVGVLGCPEGEYDLDVRYEKL